MVANKNNVMKYQANLMYLLRGGLLLSDYRMCPCIIGLVKREDEP
jgi:hypothetical protein